MGLDMFLYAEIKAPKDSPLVRLIDDHLTKQIVEELDFRDPAYPDYVPEAYLSGWTYGDKEPDLLYEILSKELGVTPTSDSPSIHLLRDGAGGYLVRPTIFYWRKMNAIHHWFVQKAQGGVDDCRMAPVHAELLCDLIDRCERITVDHDQKHLLKPVGGFFFGSTDYDEWFFLDVEATAKGLKAQVEAVAPKASGFIYHSSW